MTSHISSRVLVVCLMAATSVVTMGGSCTLPIGGATQGCRSAIDCGAFQECNSGLCRCVDNRGCGSGEFCNSAAQCQTIAGCVDNTDCEEQGAMLICNTKAGQCEPSSVCFDDSNCALNKICDQSGSCIDACRDEADCVPGAGCLRETSTQPLGRCQVGACSTTQQCPAGHNCDLTTHLCVFDDRGPFCGPCQNFNDEECGAGQYANYCLVDTSDPLQQSHFCGIDCSQEQGCPSGYECSDVIIVGPPATPACGVEGCIDGRCTQTGGNCMRHEDCLEGPPGGTCARGKVGICTGTLNRSCMSDTDCEGEAVGSCRKATCSGGESSAFGFCSCVIDADCPPDECMEADLSDPNNPVFGHCRISGRRCLDTITDCSTIACVNGGCLIGQNCAPSGERRCQDLLNP